MATGMGSTLTNVDPLYPTMYGTVSNPTDAEELMDTCLTTVGLDDPMPTHYHMASPCILDQNKIAQTSQEPCALNENCRKGYKQYAAS